MSLADCSITVTQENTEFSYLTTGVISSIILAEFKIASTCRYQNFIYSLKQVD